MAYTNEPSYAAATLLVVSEVIQARTDVRLALYSMDGFNKAPAERAEEDSDEEEIFVDADREDQTVEKAKVEKTISEYDAIKMEPKYANADQTPLWELATLARHCHPTICKWAEKLLNGTPIEYVGDPLLDFSIANFLDRISYKNPKASDKID